MVGSRPAICSPAPLQLELVLHQRPQRTVASEDAATTTRLLSSSRVRQTGVVIPVVAGAHVSAQFPCDRRRRPIQAASDLTNTALLSVQDSDALALEQ
ncbi:hypothetical protein [Rhodococcus wratislaviensis]|uniref:hypothetical protein n=1 Tax=Rhodococcus wratislaviensis TaxID=44752 RepID=UPI0020D133FD|nr:hypothetical protein [Rhodococcus wratislaviensis]